MWRKITARWTARRAVFFTEERILFIVQLLLAFLLVLTAQSTLRGAEAPGAPTIEAVKAGIEWLDLDIEQSRKRLNLLDRELTELDELHARINALTGDAKLLVEVKARIDEKIGLVQRNIDELHAGLNRAEANRAELRKELRRLRGLRL